MRNQSTGLPQSFTKSGLWRKLDGDEVDSVAAEMVADGVGFDELKTSRTRPWGRLASLGQNTHVDEMRTIEDH